MKKILVSLAVVFLSSFQPTGKPVPSEDMYTLIFTKTQLDAVVRGLYKIPYEEAAPILQDMTTQVQLQIKAAREKAKADSIANSVKPK